MAIAGAGETKARPLPVSREEAPGAWRAQDVGALTEACLEGGREAALCVREGRRHATSLSLLLGG